MFEDNSIYDNTFNNIDEIYDSLSDIIKETEENEIKITSIIIKPIKNTFYTEIYFNKTKNGIILYDFLTDISLFFEELSNPQKLFSFIIEPGNIYIKYINEINF